MDPPAINSYISFNNITCEAQKQTRSQLSKQHCQESQNIWQCSPSLHLHPSLLPFWSLLHSEKRKTNSFPYKWSESLQLRHPVELQIFHLCLQGLCYKSLAISPVSFFLLFHFPLLFVFHLCYPLFPLLTPVFHQLFLQSNSQGLINQPCHANIKH